MARLRVLVAHGFIEARRRGSHIIMQKNGGNGAVTVTVPDHRELRIGTLISVVRQSGAPRSEFEEKA